MAVTTPSRNVVRRPNRRGSHGLFDIACDFAEDVAHVSAHGRDCAYDYDGDYGPGSYYNNGEFACQPGTWFRGEDGRRHLCQ